MPYLLEKITETHFDTDEIVCTPSEPEDIECQQTTNGMPLECSILCTHMSVDMFYIARAQTIASQSKNTCFSSCMP